MPSTHARAREALRTYALSLPGAYEDHPWGETVIKVAKKIFLFFGKGGAPHLSLGVKLPESGSVALTLPFTEPTHYGLGKAGWVTATFEGARFPLSMLKEWTLESYRAVAPKKLVAELDGEAARPAKRGRGARPSKAK